MFSPVSRPSEVLDRKVFVLAGLLTERGWGVKVSIYFVLAGFPTSLFSPVSRPSEVLDRKVSIYVCPNRRSVSP